MKQLRQYIRHVLAEAIEHDDSTSMEANLAMLVFRDEADQALMMFEMLAPMNELDLDLLATELDNRLLAEWDKIPERPPANIPLGARSPEWAEYNRLTNSWQILALNPAMKFITGNHVNRSFRPPANVYKRGSIKDTIAMALKQTASIWRKKK